MPPLTRNYPAPSRDGDSVDLLVDANVMIHGGAVIVTGSNGYARPGESAPGLTVWGKADGPVNNLGGAAGAAKVTVLLSKGTRKFQYDNDVGGTPLTQADVGKPAFLVDDHTFSGDDAGRSQGGTVVGVSPTKVWVLFPH
ncbi:MAG: hypothetical protein IT372_29895 [Polyangiaceae bacterium]|nr:hypothetical protein [Polyangiaceae bacterium]